jgi:hypothetical protein
MNRPAARRSTSRCDPSPPGVVPPIVAERPDLQNTDCDEETP